jgi:hypothetical protein
VFVSAADFAMTGTDKVRAEGARRLAERLLVGDRESTRPGAVG